MRTDMSGGLRAKQSSQQFANRASGLRVLEVGRDLAEWPEDERSLVKPRVWDDERRRVDDEIAVEDQIEVERPRGAQERSLAPPFALDRHQLAQQRLGRKR